jgi:hypothetical protein
MTDIWVVKVDVDAGCCRVWAHQQDRLSHSPTSSQSNAVPSRSWGACLQNDIHHPPSPHPPTRTRPPCISPTRASLSPIHRTHQDGNHGGQHGRRRHDGREADYRADGAADHRR